MKAHDLIPFSLTALDARPAGAPKAKRQRNTARLFGLPAALFLCLVSLLHPLRAGAGPLPTVQLLNVPSEVLIGDTFTFTVVFWNNGLPNVAADIGYAPFVDIVLDHGGADKCKWTGGHPDGLKLISAKLVTGGPLNLTVLPPGGVLAPCPPTSLLPVPLAHPYFASYPPLQNVTVLPAEALYTLELPFGHYENTQPKLEIEVTVEVDKWADPNFALRLCARGGFRYGDGPLNNPTLYPPIVSTASLGLIAQNDSAQWPECASVKPTVMTLSKGYLGPEGEAATGTNYVNFYPLTYTLNVNIADQQTITNLIVRDCLPPTLVYQNNVAVSIHSVTAVGGTTCGTGIDYVLTQTPSSTSLPLNNSMLEISFCNPVTGTTAGDEVSITFQFFLPENDANGQPILPPGCSSIITNILKAEGEWYPNDPCDPVPIQIFAGPITNTITAKCLAAQKSVRFMQPGDFSGAFAGDLNYPGATPGDYLRYEINFQISDYKTIGKLLLTDCMSDGQYLEWNAAPWPQLTVQDQFGTVQGDFTAFNYGIDWTVEFDTNCLCDPIGLSASRFVFDLSSLMGAQFPPDARHASGILTGGWASSPVSATPATGTLVFYAKIYDEFFFLPTNYVDKHDPLLNCVVVEGELYQNVNAPAVPLPAGVFTSDDSSAGLSIVSSNFNKSVYAVNGQLTWLGFPNPPVVGAGDTVTFRLIKTFPDGDAEDVMVQDWPPLPALQLHDPNNTGALTWSWPGAPALYSGLPPISGAISYGPNDTLHLNGVLPSITASLLVAGDNSLKFSYGTFNNPANSPWRMDLLFTVTVQNDPMADGLFLNNQAMECEKNTLQQTFCEVSLGQIRIGAPNLKITKGIVASDNPKSMFSQTALGPITFTAPGDTSCERFTGGIINSTTIATMPGLDSDLSCADAGDRLTFAIVVQNLGSGPKGAFDIFIQETLPACLVNPGNFCITDGAGTVIPTAGNLFSSSLELIDGVNMGALAAAHSTSGEDIAVITFDATYAPGFQPQCCTNHVAVTNYSNVEGGANYVPLGYVVQKEDTAEICSQPKPMSKCIMVTSENHTTLPAVAIGEVIRYRLVVQIPEGPTSAGFNVRDMLPTGLSYLGNPTVLFVADTGVANLLNAPYFVGDETALTGCGQPPSSFAFPNPVQINPTAGGTEVVFNTQTFFNQDNDPNCEFLIIDFNALVENIPGNQAGTVLPNQFAIFDFNTPIGLASPPVSVTVFEPNIDVLKQVLVKPQQIGGVVAYTVTFVNQGPFATTAFDVRVRDPLPGCLGQLNFNLISVKDAGTGAGLVFANSSSSSVLDITLASVLVNQTVVVTYTAHYLCSDCDKLTNTATVTWTSLPLLNGTCANLTGQCTPGNSGTFNGERNGTGGVNDYIDASSANLCPDLSVTKTAMGDFMAGLNGTYMITVVNNGCGPAFAPVTVTDTVPAGLTPVSAAGNNWVCNLSGATVTATYTGAPIPAGGSFPPIIVSVAIGGGLGGTTLLNCATVQSGNDNNPLNNTGCVSVNVLSNNCLAITNEVITCTTNGEYTFSFDLINLSSFPAYSVSFTAPSPFGVTITPDPFILNPPLNPGDAPRKVTVTVSGPACAKVCFYVSIHDKLDLNCCTPNSAIPKCIVLPDCGCVAAPPGMVGWWRGDNSAQNSANAGNNGAWVGTPSYVAGEVDFAFSMASPANYVSVPHNASINFGIGVSFSIDAWVRSVNPGIAAIVDKRAGNIFAATGYSLYLFSGNLGLQLNGVNYISAGPLINDGEWYHVAAVVDRPNGLARLYVNGTQVHSVAVSPGGSVANNGDFRIGHDRFLNSSFQGQIDEVEVFRRALTQPEIKSLWQAGCAGKCKCLRPLPAGMVDWWTFNETSGIYAYDIAGTYNNKGTNNGTHVPGKVGYALCFNGVNQQMLVPNQAEVNFTGTCPFPGAQDITIDLWFRTTQSGLAPLLEKRINPSAPRGYALRLSNGQLQFVLGDGSSSIAAHYTAPGPLLNDGQWHFVAVTVDRCSGAGKMYVDGNLTPVLTFTAVSGNIANNTALLIGRRSAAFGSVYYNGCIDELEFFKRALTDTEVYSIWNAGVAGKCRPGVFIVQGPVKQSVQAGATAVFRVDAFSDDPLTYEWRFNGAHAWSSNDVLTIANAQPTNAGAYSVVVTSDSGSVTSAVATLTVVGPGNSCTVPLLPGDNLIANQFVNGDNLLSTVLPGMPDGTTLYQYSGGGFRVSTYIDGVWEGDDLDLVPGEGAIFRNNSGAPFTVTFTGAPVIDVLPRALTPGFNLVSRQSHGTGTFANIVGLAPQDGMVVYQFDAAYGGNAGSLEDDGYTSCSFVDGAWDSDCVALPGEAVWIEVGLDTAPPALLSASANCESNKVTLTFSEPLEALTATEASNYAFSGGVLVQSTMLSADGKTVCLFTSPLSAGVTYTLTVNNVADLVGNVIAADSQVTFSCPTNDLPPYTVVMRVVPGGMLKFEWSDPNAVLQSADNLTGAPSDWTDVPGAVSGHMVNPGPAPKRFYRLRYE